MRLFLAVDPGPNAKAQLRRTSDALKPLHRKARWINQTQAHLTLAFLGEVEREHVEWIHESMREAARTSGPFRMALGGAGAFPNWREPHVLWIGVREGVEALSRITLTLRVGLSMKGFPLEAKPFEPHLTLCRSKDSLASLRPETERLGADEGWRLSGHVVTELELIHSTLTAEGPKHSVIERTRLKGPS